MVKQQATGFEDAPVAVDADMHMQAPDPCEANGQVLELLSRKVTQPPYNLGNFPSAHIELRCKPR